MGRQIDAKFCEQQLATQPSGVCSLCQRAEWLTILGYVGGVDTSPPLSAVLVPAVRDAKPWLTKFGQDRFCTRY